MADAQQPSQAAPLAPRPPAGKGPFAARLAAAVAGHAYLSLAVIVVLLILVIGLYVYYHGLFFLGPYAPAKKGAGRAKKKGDTEAGAEEASGDPETERLIDSINRH